MPRLITSFNQTSEIHRLFRIRRQPALKARLSSCARNSCAKATNTPSESSKDPNTELFEYTTSRWLFNEKHRLLERRRVFDIAGFKTLAAQSIHQKPEDVIRLEKVGEGSFYRVFRITMRNGFEFIGRIPYPLTKPRRLIIASEVATMGFLRLHGLPVPKVFGYSATPNNAAGVEYIFMELVAGTCLRRLWTDDLPQEDKLAFVEKLVKLESRIFALQFPASGSLYYSKDLEAQVRKMDIKTPYSNENGKFCVGPDSDPNLWLGKRSELEVDRGPLLNCGAKKEIAYLKRFGRLVHPLPRMYREFFDYQKQTPARHLEVLKKYVKITPHLVPHDKRWARPALRNPNLSVDNVMVSRSLEITGLIGWYGLYSFSVEF
ncbi:kinase subdomain-containing protein [Phyllosticta citriasiana]|uniref:Kinase subdomain-containing protein n=1 Tax=Phyllosticta citriasiana TaxID=595635 RepID=A0ABR1KRN0_9PEZI